MSARKYGQRGYMEDEPRARSGEQRPRRERQGPGGRGLGRPTATRFKCARCGAVPEDAAEIGIDAVCGSCGSDLHTCSNCRHFDTSARFECLADVPERVAGKSKRTSCALFEPKLVQVFAADGGGEDDPKAAFDSLFDF